jgi:hypothetical protein
MEEGVSNKQQIFAIGQINLQTTTNTGSRFSRDGITIPAGDGSYTV